VRPHGTCIVAYAGGSGQHHQSLDQSASYDIRDAVVAHVKVAIEPPSPTETHRQLTTTFSSPPVAPSTDPVAVGPAQPRRSDQKNDVSVDYDARRSERERDVNSEVKSGRQNKPRSPLFRRVTSPEAVITPSLKVGHLLLQT